MGVLNDQLSGNGEKNKKNANNEKNEKNEKNAKNLSSGLPKVTIAGSLLVLLLALGAVVIPGREKGATAGRLLIFTSPGKETERQALFADLREFLGAQIGHPLDIVQVTDKTAFLREATSGADFILCPDGLALALDAENYGPLVAGRRKMPTNLRPRGVLVFRLDAGPSEAPWDEVPERTVFGDSLSLVAVGLRQAGNWNSGCAFGPDPYDHGPALHALRLGAFDYALVRQWDAESFFTAGLLDPSEFGMVMRTPPFPDIVLMADREASLVDRVRWAEDLALLNVEDQPVTELGTELSSNLECLGLTGFHLLLEPDFERLRRQFGDRWSADGN